MANDKKQSEYHYQLNEALADAVHEVFEAGRDIGHTNEEICDDIRVILCKESGVTIDISVDE